CGRKCGGGAAGYRNCRDATRRSGDCQRRNQKRSGEKEVGRDGEVWQEMRSAEEASGLRRRFQCFINGQIRYKRNAPNDEIKERFVFAAVTSRFSRKGVGSVRKREFLGRGVKNKTVGGAFLDELCLPAIRKLNGAALRANVNRLGSDNRNLRDGRLIA